MIFRQISCEVIQIDLVKCGADFKIGENAIEKTLYHFKFSKANSQ